MQGSLGSVLLILCTLRTLCGRVNLRLSKLEGCPKLGLSSHALLVGRPDLSQIPFCMLRKLCAALCMRCLLRGCSFCLL